MLIYAERGAYIFSCNGNFWLSTWFLESTCLLMYETPWWGKYLIFRL